MEEDEQKKIDLKQHALPSVSRKYLFRIILYAVILTSIGVFMYYMYNRSPEPTRVKNPKDIKEIRGITLSDSIL